jgi:hypothetical protein
VIGVDFTIYRNDALRAWTQGWHSYYAPILNDAGFYNVNPPLQGLVMLPFLTMSPLVGFGLWTLLGLLIWGGIGWILGIRVWWHLAILLLLYPIVWGLALGQVVFLVAAAIVGAWWLSEHQHGYLAGLVLSLATLKPQLIFLLPLVLLLTGRRREFGGFVVGATFIAGLSWWLVGNSGLTELTSNLRAAAPIAQLTMFYWLGGWGWVLCLAAAGLTLKVAWRVRTQAVGVAYAVGVIGSMASAPYLHTHDLALWLVAGLLVRRSQRLPSGLAAVGLFSTWLEIAVPLLQVAGLIWLGWRPPAATTPAAGLVEPVSAPTTV